MTLDPAKRALALLIVIFGLATVLVLQKSPNAASTDAEASYKRRVKELIAENILFPSEDGKRIMTRAEDAELVKGIAYLRADMANPGAWEIVNGRVIENIADHSVSGPFAPRGTWRGSLSYAESASEDSNWVPLEPTTANAPPIHLVTTADFSWANEDVGTAIDIARQGPPIVTRLARLACPIDDNAANGLSWAAVVYRVGDQVMIAANRESRCRTKAAGRALATPCNLDVQARCLTSAVALGETFTVSQGDRQIVAYRVRRVRSEGGGEILSRTNVGNATYPEPATEPFARLIAADLSGSLKGCGGTLLAIGCTDTVKLSLDREIERDAAQAATDHVLLDRPSIAAVTVMNALSGDILAVAGGRNLSQNGRGGPIRDCRFEPLCLLPIGSTAKPIFASAVVTAEGRFSKLLINPVRSGDRQSILGFRVGHLANHNRRGLPDGSLDLAQFLIWSDNHYAASMMLLASSEGPPACPSADGMSYRFNGSWSVMRPRSPFENRQCRPYPRSAPRPKFQPGWAETLRAAFEVNPDQTSSLPPDLCSAPGFFGADYHDARPWQMLFRNPAGPGGCRMLSSAPDREWFNISSITSFREQLVPLVLGDGDGKWTTIKLAEAYSRIATGRRIFASYLHRAPVEERVGANGFEPARIAVSEGLAGVLSGTAAGTEVVPAVATLRGKLRNLGLELGVFAKTGTMVLPPETHPGCLIAPKPNPDDCVGKAFVIVLAVYDRDARDLDLDAAGKVRNARARARCAITIAVNLPQWNGKGSANSAATAAAAIIGGAMSERLTSIQPGGYCAR